MASATSEHVPSIPPDQATPGESHQVPVPPESWFDRSSITADVMVMIEGVDEQEWWKLAPEGRVCEYLDGVVYMPSPASEEHQDDVGFWFFLLSGFVSERKTGKVLLGPGVLRLAPGRNPEPDIFVIPNGPAPHSPPAELVVETLSQSTRTHDLGRKKDAFQEARIPEIVYVDLKRRRITFHRLVDDLYSTQFQETGIWRSEALPGFWIEVSWLWEEPLRNRFQCLQSILDGPPA